MIRGCLVCVICICTCVEIHSFILKFIHYNCSHIEHVNPMLCAYLIIFLGVLNLDIITSTDRFHSFIFKFCKMIVHTLQMCTADAGPKQNLVLFILESMKTDRESCLS